MSGPYKPDFKGSGVLFLCNVVLSLLVTAPFVSFCLMGAKWTPVFFTMLALSLPFVLLAAFLVSRFDGFSFDDEQQHFLLSARRSVPYQNVTRIDINETGRVVQVGLKQGSPRRVSLVYALHKNDKARLMEELRKRLPDVVVRERRHVDWKTIAMILTVIGLLTAVFHLSLYRSHPEYWAKPQQVEWPANLKKPKNAQKYVVGQFSIVMHKRFDQAGRDEGFLQFEDRATKTEIQFIVGQQAAFFPYAIGIHDYYDVLETAYMERVGVVPLALKMLALSGLTEVSLYEVRQPLLRGFLTQGRKAGQEVVSIMLIDAKTGADIHVSISAPVRFNEKALREIVSGISVHSDS